MSFVIFFLVLGIVALMALTQGGRIILLGMVAIIAAPALAILLYIASRPANGGGSGSNSPPPATQPSLVQPVSSCDGPGACATGGATGDPGFRAAGAPAQPAGQPPLDPAQVERGVDEVQALLPAGGLAAAAAASARCYADLSLAPSWSGWDHCAAMDEAGFKTFNPHDLRAPSDPFSRASVDQRALRALTPLSADAGAGRERIAALRAMADRALGSIAQRAAERSLQGRSR